jgi:hypothetical protein
MAPATKAKKQKKITKAPSGISFLYEPKQPNEKTPCPECGEGQLFTTEREDGFLIFCCSECDWCSPSGNFTHEPTKRSTHHVCTEVVKKQKPMKPNRQLRDAVRKEARRRMRALVKLRETMPKDSNKLTTKQREKLHAKSFSIVEIRDELKAES